ncbi:MAG: PEP/pyruvate-binding domain-containing protein, partial [Candidatus Omnitrophica bacterium]|nr:PEP/pyruvate-binding domain-containing protein [Candidatus Omnitrophota bacterium]
NVFENIYDILHGVAEGSRSYVVVTQFSDQEEHSIFAAANPALYERLQRYATESLAEARANGIKAEGVEVVSRNYRNRQLEPLKEVKIISDTVVPLDTPLAGRENIAVLGGKGTGLVDMKKIPELKGRIPDGFILTLNTYRQWARHLAAFSRTEREAMIQAVDGRTLPGEIKKEIREAMARLCGQAFPDEKFDVSVRSGSVRSMPGLMKTITKVRGYDGESGLFAAVEKVLLSWDSDAARDERASRYGKRDAIPDNLGTAVIIQKMVYGTDDETYRGRGAYDHSEISLAGVFYGRNATSEEDKISVSFKLNATGEEVVGGQDTVYVDDVRAELAAAKAGAPAKIPAALVPILEELIVVAGTLEAKYKYPQDIEFTVDHGQLFLLQTRDVELLPHVGVRVLDALSRDPGIALPQEEAFDRAIRQVRGLSVTSFDDSDVSTRFLLTQGLGTSEGAVSGRIAFSRAAVDRLRQQYPGDKVIYITTDADVRQMDDYRNTDGVISLTGDPNSHVAINTRRHNIPCVVGAKELSFRRSMATGQPMLQWQADIRTAHDFYEGDILSFDGTTGAIYEGAVKTRTSGIDKNTYEQLLAGGSMLELVATIDTMYPRGSKTAVEELAVSRVPDEYARFLAGPHTTADTARDMALASRKIIVDAIQEVTKYDRELRIGFVMTKDHFCVLQAGAFPPQELDGDNNVIRGEIVIKGSKGNEPGVSMNIFTASMPHGIDLLLDRVRDNPYLGDLLDGAIIRGPKAARAVAHYRPRLFQFRIYGRRGASGVNEIKERIEKMRQSPQKCTIRCAVSAYGIEVTFDAKIDHSKLNAPGMYGEPLPTLGNILIESKGNGEMDISFGLFETSKKPTKARAKEPGIIRSLKNGLQSSPLGPLCDGATIKQGQFRTTYRYVSPREAGAAAFRFSSRRDLGTSSLDTLSSKVAGLRTQPAGTAVQGRLVMNEHAAIITIDETTPHKEMFKWLPPGTSAETGFIILESRGDGSVGVTIKLDDNNVIHLPDLGTRFVAEALDRSDIGSLVDNAMIVKGNETMTYRCQPAGEVKKRMFNDRAENQAAKIRRQQQYADTLSRIITTARDKKGYIGISEMVGVCLLSPKGINLSFSPGAQHKKLREEDGINPGDGVEGWIEVFKNPKQNEIIKRIVIRAGRDQFDVFMGYLDMLEQDDYLGPLLDGAQILFGNKPAPGHEVFHYQVLGAPRRVKAADGDIQKDAALCRSILEKAKPGAHQTVILQPLTERQMRMEKAKYTNMERNVEKTLLKSYGVNTQVLYYRADVGAEELRERIAAIKRLAGFDNDLTRVIAFTGQGTAYELMKTVLRDENIDPAKIAGVVQGTFQPESDTSRYSTVRLSVIGLGLAEWHRIPDKRDTRARALSRDIADLLLSSAENARDLQDAMTDNDPKTLIDKLLNGAVSFRIKMIDYEEIADFMEREAAILEAV